MGIRSISVAAISFVMVFLGGCHVHTYSTGVPLYDRSEAVIDPTLMGVWSNDETRLTINVAPPYGMSTRFECNEPGATADSGDEIMPTDFVPIGSYTYLFPYQSPEDYWRAEYGLMFRIARDGDALVLSILDGSTAERLLQENEAYAKATCETTRVRDASTNQPLPSFTVTRVALPSGQFRAFLVDHEQDHDLFVALPPLRRVR